MEKETNYAKGIYLVKFKSKEGKDYLKLSIKKEDGTFDKFVCFESKTKPKYGDLQYSIIVDEPKEQISNKQEKEELTPESDDDLPF